MSDRLAQLRSLADGVGDLQHGQPGDEDHYTAADVIRWAVAEIERNTRDQQPQTKEAAPMSEANERSVASAGSVAGKPAAWAVLRENGTVYACHKDREMVVAVAGDRRIVSLWTRARNSFLSPEPVAYCLETALHGWEIASPAAAAEEPELNWSKMVVQ